MIKELSTKETDEICGATISDGLLSVMDKSADMLTTIMLIPYALTLAMAILFINGPNPKFFPNGSPLKSFDSLTS